MAQVPMLTDRPATARPNAYDRSPPRRHRTFTIHGPLVRSDGFPFRKREQMREVVLLDKI